MEKPVGIGARVSSDGQGVAFQMAGIAIAGHLLANLLRLIAGPRLPPDPSPIRHRRERRSRHAFQQKTRESHALKKSGSAFQACNAQASRPWQITKAICQTRSCR
jgi:hypothetical protein